MRATAPRPDWNAIWEAASRKHLEEQQRSNLEKLRRGDPEAVAKFLSDWDDAVRIDHKITALRNRTPEEVEAARKINREAVEKNRWKSQPVRTSAQLIADNRKKFLSDMPVLYHVGEW